MELTVTLTLTVEADSRMAARDATGTLIEQIEAFKDADMAVKGVDKLDISPEPATRWNDNA